MWVVTLARVTVDVMVALKVDYSVFLKVVVLADELVDG